MPFASSSLRVSAARVFALSLFVGAVIVGTLWICVRISGRSGAISGASRLHEPLEGGQRLATEQGAALAQNVRDMTSQQAGYMVLVFGVCGVPAAAIAIAWLYFQHASELEELAEKSQWLTSETVDQPLEIPADTSPLVRTVYRHLADNQEGFRRKFSKLEAEKRRGFEVLSHMTDGVLAISSDRRVVLLNPATARLLGLKRQNLLGRRLAEVVRIPQIVTAVDKVLGGQGTQFVEFDLPSDTETSLRVQAIELPSDGELGVLVTIRDETQVKHLERMRREFIANVSHELKTPLAAVRGYAETLQLGAKDEPETCEHFLEQINQQAARLERLINDMLQLARAQTGSQHLTLNRVPLLPVLRESVATYEPVANARDIELKFHAPPGDAAVIADREALITIANNLIGNAVRYTPEGGWVEISVEAREKRWAIVVQDNGIGIPQADQERIFERFYRVEKARDATRGGTGLGLSIVKNLVQALEGEIHLHSESGVGSKFEVELPASS